LSIPGGADGRCVGDDLDRCDLQRGQGSAEEPAGGVGVPTCRHEHVDDLPVLVDRPVDVAPHAVDFHVGFVDEPAVTGGVPSEPGRVCEQRGETLHPPVDGDMVNLDPRSNSSSSTSR
jgi:hypothetical protein